MLADTTLSIPRGPTFIMLSTNQAVHQIFYSLLFREFQLVDQQKPLALSVGLCWIESAESKWKVRASL